MNDETTSPQPIVPRYEDVEAADIEAEEEIAAVVLHDRVFIEGPETDPQMTHIERINRDTPNPAHIPGLDIPHPPTGRVYVP